MNLTEFEKLDFIREGLIEQVRIPEENSGGDFAVKYSGYIKIPKNGFYNFYTNSDDGTKLYIDDKLIVKNDGRHAPVEVKGFASLNKGFHVCGARQNFHKACPPFIPGILTFLTALWPIEF